MKKYMFNNFFNKYVEYHLEKISMDIPNSVKSGCFNYINDILYKKFIKILIIEINTYRIENKFLSKKPENQYEEFEKSILLVEDTYFFRKYRNYFIKVNEEIYRIIEYIEEVTFHYFNDKNELIDKFGIGEKIVEFNIGKGDSHRGNKNVVNIVFDNNVSIYYKPRNMNSDYSIKELSDYIRNKGIICFDVPEMLLGKEYTWQIGIKYEYTNSEDLKKVYYQFGVLAFIAYIFKITDLHMENIIISKGIVYIIDLESILQEIDIDYIEEENKETSTYKIYKELRNSIYATGLFPVTFNGNMIDVSGITGCGNQNVNGMKVINKYRSDIKLVKCKYKSSKKNNIPKVRKKFSIYDYKDYIIKGFVDISNLFVENKKEIVNLSFWKLLEKGTSRVIFKNTSTYATISNLLTNPEYLNDDSRLLSLLIKGNNKNQNKYNIYDSEIKDIREGDIPYFYRKNNSKYLYNSKGDKIYYFDEELPINFVKKRILHLNNFSNIDQIRYMNIALQEPKKYWEIGSNLVIEDKKNKIDMNSIINILVEEITSNMIKTEFGVNWLDIQINENKIWNIAPCKFDLYSGLSGFIVIYLSLFIHYGDVKYLTMAEYCLFEIEQQIKSIKIIDENISAFTGISSIIYALFLFYDVTKEKKYYRRAVELLEKTFEIKYDSQSLDYVNGLGSYLLLLCRICMKYKIRIEKQIEKIVEIYKENWNTTHGWYSDIISKTHINGMAHGISGIAIALNLANKILQRKDIKSMVKNSIKIENKSIRKNNWIDLRNLEKRRSNNIPDPVHWCHGASGIGMSRIIIDSVKYSDDIEIARQAILENGIEYSDCLCHGNMGNIEFFILDYVKNKKEDSKMLAEKIFINLCCNRRKFFCGIPQKTPVYGLMLGIGGICYEILRLVEPNHIPSVLFLEFL